MGSGDADFGAGEEQGRAVLARGPWEGEEVAQADIFQVGRDEISGGKE